MGEPELVIWHLTLDGSKAACGESGPLGPAETSTADGRLHVRCRTCECLDEHWRRHGRR